MNNMVMQLLVEGKHLFENAYYELNSLLNTGNISNDDANNIEQTKQSLPYHGANCNKNARFNLSVIFHSHPVFGALTLIENIQSLDKQ